MLLVSPVSSFTAHPYFHDKLPYDPKDLIPVARISKTVVAVSVPASLGVNSLKELEALARAKPGQLNWTTATGFTDFVFAGFLHTRRPEDGEGAVQESGRRGQRSRRRPIQVYMPAYAIVRPQVAAGKVKVLAVTNHDRAPALARRSDGARGRLSVARIRRAGRPVRSARNCRMTCANAHRQRRQGGRAAIPPSWQKMTATGQIVSPGDGAEFAASIAAADGRRSRRWRNCSATSRCNRPLKPVARPQRARLPAPK